MTAEMHELVDEIHACRHAHEQPANVWCQKKAKHCGHRNRYQNEDDQGIRRKYRYTPILIVTKSHFIVSEKLMVIERVTFVDGAQSLNVHRSMHDEFMDRPFEYIGE